MLFEDIRKWNMLSQQLFLMLVDGEQSSLPLQLTTPMVMPRILFLPNLHCLRMENIIRSHKMEDIGDYPVESVS
jgi:hypothetical protein